MATIDLISKADFIRKDILRVATANGAGHIAPSLSSVDILTALYYSVMEYRPDDPEWEGRDRLIFSKSHGCYGHYAILADLGVIPKDQWDGFYTDSSDLAGCAERRLEFGLEAGCGSLGHGLPLAVGIACGAKMLGKDYHVYCVVGDGEFQEGTCWESIIFAHKFKLDNLTIIIDWNGLQAMDFITNILDRERDDLYGRLSGFGLNLIKCDGHNPLALVSCLNELHNSKSKRTNIILAETIKGYGLKCMENVPKFHFRLPTEQELQEGGRNV